MDSETKGARRIAQLTLELLENASEEPQRLSQMMDEVSVEASRKTSYRVLDALQQQNKIEKVNADGESDENGKSWALTDG
jgi:Fe2+ or Zn2+ uptake regulation protein